MRMRSENIMHEYTVQDIQEIIYEYDIGIVLKLYTFKTFMVLYYSGDCLKPETKITQ